MAFKRLTDEQWDKIEYLIPEQGRGRPRTRDREILDAIIYVLTTGCQWDNLPKEFPPKSTVHDRFKAWEKEKFFKRLLKYLRRMLPENTVYYIDTAIRMAKKGRQDFTSWQNQRQQNLPCSG